MSKILCAFGQYNYGDPQRGLGIEYLSFTPALKKLGHQVLHHETWQQSSWKTLQNLNRSLLERVLDEQPDVLLVVPYTNELWIETLDIIKKLGVSTICWTTDDSWKYREHSRYYGQIFQAMTTTYPDKLPSYARDGIQNVLLTQWGACSEHLVPPLTAEQCKYDVTFVGAAHGSRASMINRLRELGLEVTCFGHGWPQGSIPSADIPVIMRASRISLNFANSKGVNQIKARNFEVPGAGGFLLAEHAPGLDQFYTPDTEMVTFKTLEQLVEQAQYYLAHPQERDRIAHAGYERTLREHTYEHRMEAVVNFALKHRPHQQSISPEQARESLHKISTQSAVTPLLKVFRNSLIQGCQLVWGESKGKRAARKMVYELSRRTLGVSAFKAAGPAGRMFGWMGNTLDF
jgi:spore maturation protein CgeB